MDKIGHFLVITQKCLYSIFFEKVIDQKKRYEKRDMKLR